MVFQVAASASRRAATRVAQQQQKRSMGGGGPKPEWEGIDKVVRQYFPEDYQLAGAILGGYSGLIAVAMIRSKIKGAPPAEEPAAVSEAPAVPATGGVPSVESPEFEKFIESDAFMKMVESEEQLLQWAASAEK
mmetsp:Transcript_15697/g.18925  ORF Transcript_15697/g.18925 Transcript_15697/m.18925 type:complete len:134 (-) Transcript_15697:190-591(-)|eukprot:CAMPEP_0195268548 /NCGR_PEP_ID=MMETSP0706-20130129/13246_1 /TAXON_ID=33640 /ORGANISM="Asterionellopsis glacialis, Strain CCMP134" /LENGTH=133 /DNA_ID=CAMNT_0040323501 /DNA_START=31 /DNA_END=432 /DNA_ORIENTATION=+